MGSKHSPPRWWNLGGVEEALEDRRRFGEARDAAKKAQILAQIDAAIEQIKKDPHLSPTAKEYEIGTLRYERALFPDHWFRPPAYIGDVPVLNEMYVIPAREPTAVGWTTWMYSGSELLDVATGQPIPATRDLARGEEVLAPTLFGYFKAVVISPTRAETEFSVFYLERDADDRHAWTCASAGNKAAIQKLQFQTGLKPGKDD